MEPVTLDTLQSFLQRLGERYPSAGILYLLGGSALRPPTPAFDPYSIALSKIARGFGADLEDVMFLLHEGLIEFGELERHFNAILPDASKADIDPTEFRGYFEEIRRRQK